MNNLVFILNDNRFSLFGCNYIVFNNLKLIFFRYYLIIVMFFVILLVKKNIYYNYEIFLDIKIMKMNIC